MRRFTNRFCQEVCSTPYRSTPASNRSTPRVRSARTNYTWLSSQISPSQQENRRRFVHSLATLDSQAIFDGGWLLPLGQELALDNLVAAYRRLPAGGSKPSVVPSSRSPSARSAAVTERWPMSSMILPGPGELPSASIARQARQALGLKNSAPCIAWTSKARSGRSMLILTIWSSSSFRLST